MRHIASRAFAIPPNIDILYCEQEVVADDLTAVESVLKADVKRTELLEECKKLEEAFQSGNLDAQEKLNDVYAELKAIGADSAEPKARRILAGLGFTKAMQVLFHANRIKIFLQIYCFRIEQQKTFLVDGE